jgi:hypothetical protein
LPFIDANFHKLGLNKSSEEWKTVKKVMTAELKLVVRASGEMAKNKQDPMRQAKAIKGLDIALGTTRSFTSAPVEPGGSEGTGEHQSTQSSGSAEPAQEAEQNLNQITLEGVVYSLHYQFDVLDDVTIPWDYLYDTKTRDLLAVINTQSRLFETSTDQEFIGILALSEAVVGFLIKELGYQYSRARELRDSWLFEALGSRVRVKS